MALQLNEIITRLGGELRGDGQLVVSRIAPIESAGEGDIAFLSNPKYQAKLATTRASAVIVAPNLADACPVAAIVHAQPYLYFARLAQWLSPPPAARPGIAATATVLSALPDDVSVGPGVFIAEEVSIAAGCVIGANCVIERGASMGAGSRLYPNVSIYHDCHIGQRVIIHSGTVIGADGFGYAREKDGAWLKIPQTGRVVIGDDVEIGANTTIDRGALADTVIEEGVKIDNQIQIAHNVRIGAHTALAGCVGIAGSTTIGKRCTFGGAAMIHGHIEICDDVNVSAGTMISKNIITPGNYTGSTPSMEHSKWLQNYSRLRHLDSMADRIRALETRLNELENGK